MQSLSEVRSNEPTAVDSPAIVEVRHIIAPIFPTIDVHAIAGGAGTNVLNLSFHLCDSISTGKPFLGYTLPRPFRVVYMAQGPSRRTFDDLRTKMGVTFPVKYRTGKESFKITDIIDAVKDTGAEVVFLEHMERLIENHDAMGKGVAIMFGELHERCEELKITIFGTWVGPKEYTSSRPRLVRERISGSGVASHCAGTQLTMDALLPDVVEDKCRKIHIQPQVEDSRTMDVELGADGRFVIRDTVMARQEDAFVTEILKYRPGALLTLQDMMSLVIGLSKSTVLRRVKQLVEDGTLEHKQRDRYMRLGPPSVH